MLLEKDFFLFIPKQSLMIVPNYPRSFQSLSVVSIQDV